MQPASNMSRLKLLISMSWLVETQLINYVQFIYYIDYYIDYNID